MAQYDKITGKRENHNRNSLHSPFPYEFALLTLKKIKFCWSMPQWQPNGEKGSKCLHFWERVQGVTF